MKPDLSLFPYYKEESEFPKWWKRIQGVLHGTGMGLIIEWGYSPPPYPCTETDSFKNKCKWLFTVLDKTVLITEGRNILNDWRYTCDGRATLAVLVTHAWPYFYGRQTPW